MQKTLTEFEGYKKDSSEGKFSELVDNCDTRVIIWDSGEGWLPGLPFWILLVGFLWVWSKFFWDRESG